MLPRCDYGRCKSVSKKRINLVIPSAPQEWLRTSGICRYVCEKHYDKIISLLGLKVKLRTDFKKEEKNG